MTPRPMNPSESDHLNKCLTNAVQRALDRNEDQTIMSTFNVKTDRWDTIWDSSTYMAHNFMTKLEPAEVLIRVSNTEPYKILKGDEYIILDDVEPRKREEPIQELWWIIADRKAQEQRDAIAKTHQELRAYLGDPGS